MDGGRSINNVCVTLDMTRNAVFAYMSRLRRKHKVDLPPAIDLVQPRRDKLNVQALNDLIASYQKQL
jgi:hypothetical protein